MYNPNKSITFLGLLTTISFLSACGGSSTNPDSSYTSPKVMNEVKTDLKFLNTSLPSAQSTNVDTPVYRYTQIFNKENDQFKTSYRLEFDFDMDANTFYRLEADYDTLINATPNSIKLKEYEKSGQSITFKKEFQCSQNNNPCSNIVNSINMKTGQAKLDFNNQLLTKSSWADGQINTITLAGSVEGFLTEAPTKVQLPMSQAHELKWSITSSTQDGSKLLSNYYQLNFTNHNKIELFLGDRTLIEGSGIISIQNNKVESFYFQPALSPSLLEISCRPTETPCQNTSYNPNNYEITFSNTKVNSPLAGISYLNGSTGL
ncbi:hypothetical protein [Acinetobacter haemolyticus]|uniref:hypothetical protein n=1 Tax=Acinetobacter haemolyticus TaxID=29430 RepID=UPI000D6888DE|nr:hypothetical protein [Acinetobacter haemolyticus]